MKLKSISVENLGNILKKIINSALEDTDQIAKLHQAIYEEWYFTKMPELGDARTRTENTEDVLKISQDASSCSSSDLIKDTLSESSIDTSNEIKYLLKQDVEIINRNKSVGQDIPVMCNKSIGTNVCIERSERACETSKESTISNNIAPSLGIIEVKNNPAQRAKIKKLESNSLIAKHRPIKQNESRKMAKQVRRRLSFGSWKNIKNLTYRKLLKEAKEKEQRELQEKVTDIECKKGSQFQPDAQIIRAKDARQRRGLSVKLQATRQTRMETLQKQTDERRTVNDQAFNAGKRQQDAKLRETKLMTMANAPYYQPKRSAEDIGPMVLTEEPSSQFDLWLDQLDNVLHRKYLRERRHLVRSFYCQPMYYGAACRI